MEEDRDVNGARELLGTTSSREAATRSLGDHRSTEHRE